MRVIRILPLIFAIAACLPIDQIDPVVYIDGEFCPAANGSLLPVIAGYVCCPNGGQCPEDEYCYGTDECRGPIPPNDEIGAKHERRKAF